MSTMAAQNELKRAAAEVAVAEVCDGMVLGLGSGSTASIAIELLGQRVAEGLRVKGIPTSMASAHLAERYGIPLTDFAAYSQIDLTIDGADQIERDTLHLVKGLGGALLREKIVAAASRRMLVIADQSKLVETLGGLTPLPVEISSFGSETTIERLRKTGFAPQRRMTNGACFHTDGGNFIADCHIPTHRIAADIEKTLHAVTGVIECGLFIGLASEAIVATSSGIISLKPR